MIVFKADLLCYLLDKYGERFYKALTSYHEMPISNLVVSTKNGLEISASVKGSQSEYACYFGDDGYFCSCIDHTVRKTVCKHIFAMLLYSIDKGEVKMEEVLKRLIVLPQPKNKREGGEK